MPEKKEVKPDIELAPSFEWARKKAQYSNGSDCKCGKFHIGSTEWGSANGGYNAKCFLPGIKSILGNYNNEEDAKERVEYAAKYWFSKLQINLIKGNENEFSPGSSA